MSLRTRRQIVAASLALVAAGCSPRRRAKFEYKFATNLRLTHPLNVRISEAIARIGIRTGRQLNIRLFAGGQLGTDADTLSQVRSGALEFNTLSGVILSTLVPVAAASGVGFAFMDSTQVFGAMDGSLGALIRNSIRQHGLMAFEHIFDSGFRQITTNSHPVERPADLKGLKIRVPLGRLWTSMFLAFGAAPTSINFSELYSALQTRIVDGQENPLAVIDSGKLYEVQHICSLTNHMWDGFWLLANPQAVASLPPEFREIVAQEFSTSALAQRRDIEVLDNKLRSTLERPGFKFIRVVPDPFRLALRDAGFYQEWRQRLGSDAWSTLESHVGHLA